MSKTAFEEFVSRKSFIELSGRERARSLFDEVPRELLGPFDQLQSPWLPMQGIAPQADDGCIVMKGAIAGRAAVVVSLESAFQGGSIGEVSGAKMSTALELAAIDSAEGKPTAAVLLLETGGVRLQEANLGLASIAELIAALLMLRPHAPVITIVAGNVGCFGGMSLAAGLSSYIIMTREGRLGLNGPEVIEQESGIDEFDASDRAMIWAIHGGTQRVAMGAADLLVEDSVDAMRAAVHTCLTARVPAIHRSEQVDLYQARVAALDTTQQIEPSSLRYAWGGDAAEGAGR